MQSYEDRLRRVIQYIYDNPAGDLSLDNLADVAAFSRFHWHRVFHAMTGETCAEAVRRVRATRASVWLLETNDPISQIATRSGYDNPQSFARAFRDVFGMTPALFRKSGTPEDLKMTLRTGDSEMYEFELRDLPPYRLAGLYHSGPYPEIGRTFEELGAVFTSRGFWPQARSMAAIYYDSPEAVEPDVLRSFAAVEVSDDFVTPEDLKEVTLPGGRHAVLRLTGPYTGLAAAWQHLYSVCLPGSGEVPADAPPFELYPNSPFDTAPADLLTNICVPLR